MVLCFTLCVVVCAAAACAVQPLQLQGGGNTHATKETEREQYSTNGDKDNPLSPSAEVYRKLVHNNTKVVRGVATRNAD